MDRLEFMDEQIIPQQIIGKFYSKYINLNNTIIHQCFQIFRTSRIYIYWNCDRCYDGGTTEEGIDAVCDTENDNKLYRDGKQIMITTKHDIKDKFNIKQINLLQGNIIKISSRDISSKYNELTDFTHI